MEKGDEMEYKIQTIVFPTEEKHQLCKGLFYRGENGVLDRKERTLLLGKGQNIDFATYINGCSYQKWKRYTNAGNAVLFLEVEGDFCLCEIGYTKNIKTIERTEYHMQEYHLRDRQIIRYEFPENQNQMLGFEISVLDSCKIYGGYYAVICEESDLNDVCLSLATTTCRKEKFIKKNVELLKRELIQSEDNISDNLYIHVVDNGRTLTEKDICGHHVFLHPNSNAGGSGGFARGMMESLEQKPQATHVLLMDDDVLVLPESIRRTYNLLRLMKTGYKKSFISGAMLNYEEPYMQHEDIGVLNGKCEITPLKPNFHHEFLYQNLDNEGDFVKQKKQYAAWWFCCIPLHMVKEKGLPLPFFLRGDDIEYSLRCNAQIITMNGICIWHMGFLTKHNAAVDIYQRCRNNMIMRACQRDLEHVDALKETCSCYKRELMKFNYDTAELAVCALEDYLKGPEFIKINQGEKLMQDNLKLNDKMIPLNDMEEADILNVYSCYEDMPRKFIDKCLYHLTWNGQRLTPNFMYRKEIAYIAFDLSYQAQKMTLHNRLIAINPYTRSGVLRQLNKKRYKEIQKRFRKAMKYYQRNNDRITEEYREEMSYLTSDDFWKKYLGM